MNWKKPYLAPLNNNTQLTIHWLGGFTDGDASFSIFNYKYRLKFEVVVVSCSCPTYNLQLTILLELFNRIKDFFNISNNLSITN